MRKSFLAVIPALWLAAALPALAQGLQLPSSANDTPPIGTLRNGRTSTARHVAPGHHHWWNRHTAASKRPVAPVSQ